MTSADDWPPPQLSELSKCEACMATRCATCGHARCPGCIDSCDHPDCITWDEPDENGEANGTMNHVCQFPKCEAHA